MKRQYEASSSSTSVNLATTPPPPIDPSTTLPPEKQFKRTKRNIINNNIIQRNNLEDDQFLTNDLLLVVCDLLPLSSVLALLQTQYQWFQVINANGPYYCTGQLSNNVPHAGLSSKGHWQLSSNLKEVMRRLPKSYDAMEDENMVTYLDEPWFHYLSFLGRACNDCEEDMHTDGLVYLWSRFPFMPPLLMRAITTVFVPEVPLSEDERRSRLSTIFFPLAFQHKDTPLSSEFGEYLDKTMGVAKCIVLSRDEKLVHFLGYLILRVCDHFLADKSKFTRPGFWRTDFRYWLCAVHRLLDCDMLQGKELLLPLWHIVKAHVYPYSENWCILRDLLNCAGLWMFDVSITGADFFEYLYTERGNDFDLLHNNIDLLLKLARSAHLAAYLAQIQQYLLYQENYSHNRFATRMMHISMLLWEEQVGDNEQDAVDAERSEACYAIWRDIMGHAFMGYGKELDEHPDPAFSFLKGD